MTKFKSICLLASAFPAALSAASEIDFEKQIRPIFAENCYKCHGEVKQKGQLRLDSPSAILKGGDSGEPLFVAGSSAESHLINLVSGKDPDETMPPTGKGDPLNAEQLDLLRAWIDQGANLPEAAEVKLTTDHWSFQPVARKAPPKPAGKWANGAIDAFVHAAMESKGLSPSPTADRRTLIRRLYLVAHGLPPTPEEVEAFVDDASPGAYEKLVDRALASPRYGERWARHWLDVVRFAESNGFETNRERLTAYHFRDYVIDAFNSDKPYDTFIKEQIAGDAMGVDVGTGFLVAGTHDVVKSPDINLTLMQRQDELADMVNTTGTAFLGLTLGCARCHNHKFDPILQKDYYALTAVFSGVKHGERAISKTPDRDQKARAVELRKEIAENEAALDAIRQLAAKATGENPSLALRPPVNAKRNIEEFPATEAKWVRFTVRKTSGAQPCIDELLIFSPEGENVALAKAGTAATSSGNLPGYPIHKLEHINDGRFGNGRSWISNEIGKGWVALEFAKPERIARIEWGRDREGKLADRLATEYLIEASSDGKEWRPLAGSADREPFSGKPDPNAFLTKVGADDAERGRKLIGEIDTKQRELSDLEIGIKAWVGNFTQPGKTHRLYRGDPMAKREVVAPDALTVMGSLGMKVDETEQMRRMKIAEWIASDENPLTARVMVNRLWQYVFGTGIVDTPSDFGANGTMPTHPELLDWLAAEFVKSGWSVKHVLRLMLTSNTFRQSSLPRPEAQQTDSGARYLWRFPPRRLSAEAIRDSMLAVAGTLDLQMGGPGFYLLDVERENVVHYHPKEKTGPAEWRRMIYMFKIRQEQDAVFGSFDCPDGNQTIPDRSRSTTPLQALNLFNSEFTIQQAERFAGRLGDKPEQVERAFRLLYGRPADPEEIADGEAFIARQGIEAFCRALLNTNEFLFVF